MIVGFLGPSKPADLPRSGIDWRPPAGAGDVLALASRPPRIVLLIDGYFDWRPAPWHKEILLLMELGTVVAGAASMGAIRATELERFGMVGTGAVFDAFRSGRLTGDDEVAVAHAPPALGYRPVSEALVNVRATLVAAMRRKAVDAVRARIILDVARDIHFAERTWDLILAKVANEIPLAAAPALREWIGTNRVDQKAIDAGHLVRMAIRGQLNSVHLAAVPRTAYLQRLARHVAVPLPAEPRRVSAEAEPGSHNIAGPRHFPGARASRLRLP